MTIVELHETIVVKGKGVGWRLCPACAPKAALMVAPQTAAAILHLTEPELSRLVEDRKVHFSETEGTLICLKSVRDLLEEARHSPS